MTSRCFTRVGRGFLLAAALLAARLARADILEMAYPEDSGVTQRPGHFAFDYLRAAEMVVRDSGLTVRWTALPIPRMFHRLAQQDAAFCVGGAGVLPERRSLGKFSRPFIEDRMVAVMTLKSRRAALDRARSLDELIRQGNSSFLAYAGLDYGAEVTPKLATLGNRLSRAPRTTEQMLEMLQRGRADYALVSLSYGANFLAARADGGDFVLRAYPDMRRDFHMAFLCSKAVPDAVIASLDAAIARQAPRIRARFPDQAD